MKQVRIATVAALVAVLSLSACAGEKITLGLGHGQTVISVAHISLTKMAESVLDKSGGALDIQIFPANQLGNERDLAEGLQQGIIDMAWISTAVMENFDPKLSLFSLPYVFKTYDHVADVLASDIGDYVFGSLLESQDIRVLGFFDQGFRWVWNNARPVASLDDFKGLKIRAPESPVYMGTFRLLGSNATPIPWGEVYTSMQTGVVAGFECTPESFAANGLGEVTKFGSRTHHIYAGSVLMIREDLWAGLSDAHKALLADAVKEAVSANRAMILANEEGYLRDMREKNGMELNSISNEEMSRMAKAVEPLYQDYIPRLGSADIIARAQAMFKE